MAPKKNEQYLKHVTVEMHVMDKDSRIIGQNKDLILDENPTFITLNIKELNGTLTIIGMTFEDWQKLTTKLYTKVNASVLIQQETKS